MSVEISIEEREETIRIAEITVKVPPGSLFVMQNRTVALHKTTAPRGYETNYQKRKNLSKLKDVVSWIMAEIHGENSDAGDWWGDVEEVNGSDCVLITIEEDCCPWTPFGLSTTFQEELELILAGETRTIADIKKSFGL